MGTREFFAFMFVAGIIGLALLVLAIISSTSFTKDVLHAMIYGVPIGTYVIGGYLLIVVTAGFAYHRFQRWWLWPLSNHLLVVGSCIATGYLIFRAFHNHYFCLACVLIWILNAIIIFATAGHIACRKSS